MWEEGQVEKAKQLRRDGKTSAEIAKILGKTKNQIVGVLYRAKIKSERKVVTKKATIPAKFKSTPLPDRGCCHWPIGDGWCSAPVLPGSSYCREHDAKAYVRPTPKLDVSFLVKPTRRR